jgi:uncharacterized protein (DUF2141 family)
VTVASSLVPALIGIAVGTGAVGAIAPASAGSTDAGADVGVASVRHGTAERRGLLTVSISGAVPGTGKLMVALYDREAGFPGRGQHVSAQVVSAVRTTNEVAFADLPYGRYAVAIIYDRYGNGKLDMRLGVLPKEPLGFSNNAKARFGPPKFGDAAFGFDQPHKKIDVVLR